MNESELSKTLFNLLFECKERYLKFDTASATASMIFLNQENKEKYHDILVKLRKNNTTNVIRPGLYLAFVNRVFSVFDDIGADKLKSPIHLDLLLDGVQYLKQHIDNNAKTNKSPDVEAALALFGGAG